MPTWIISGRGKLLGTSLFVALILVACSFDFSALSLRDDFPTRPNQLQLPPPGQYYFSAMPATHSGDEDDFTSADIDNFEATVGHQIVWAYFSHNWFNGRKFPIEKAVMIRDRGSVPYIRLMLRSDSNETTPETYFTLDAILNGDFDDDLTAWGRKAANFETPLIVEWGTEANGQWFSWNGVHNGGPGVGPEKFVAAYRHIIDIMDAQGATNISWVFHINYADDPGTSWNAFENYYPGDNYIDWIGVSIYTLYTPMDTDMTDFRTMMDDVTSRLAVMAPSKPLVVAEFGATTNSPIGSASSWADAALADILADRWPSIIGFSWWNETWQNDDNPAHNTDFRVESDANLANVFQTRLNSPKILERPLP